MIFIVMDDDLKAILMAAGLVGLGIGVSMLSSREKHRRFHDALSKALLGHQIELVSAELGRKQTGERVWVLTINRSPEGVRTYQAAFPHNVDPYSESTFRDLYCRILNATCTQHRSV